MYSMNNMKPAVKFSAKFSFAMPGSSTGKSRINFSCQVLGLLVDE
jgi:hypothetical protein